MSPDATALAWTALGLAIGLGAIAYAVRQLRADWRTASPRTRRLAARLVRPRALPEPGRLDHLTTRLGQVAVLLTGLWVTARFGQLALLQFASE